VIEVETWAKQFFRSDREVDSNLIKYVMNQLKAKSGSLDERQVHRICDDDGHEYRRRRNAALEFVDDDDLDVEWPEGDGAKERAKSGFKSYLLDNIMLSSLRGPALMPLGKEMKEQCKTVARLYMGQTEETRISSKYAVRDQQRRIRECFAEIAEKQEQDVWGKTSAINCALLGLSKTNQPGDTAGSLKKWCLQQEKNYSRVSTGQDPLPEEPAPGSTSTNQAFDTEMPEADAAPAEISPDHPDPVNVFGSLQTAATSAKRSSSQPGPLATTSALPPSPALPHPASTTRSSTVVQPSALVQDTLPVQSVPTTQPAAPAFRGSMVRFPLVTPSSPATAPSLPAAQTSTAATAGKQKRKAEDNGAGASDSRVSKVSKLTTAGFVLPPVVSTPSRCF